MYINNSGKNEEAKVTSGLIEFFGICTTCNDAPTCRNSRDSAHPVWNCEQFDDYTPPVIDTIENTMISTAISQTKPKPEVFSTEKFKGLCINCDHRETCTNCDTEGGVWHCEEYH